MESSGKMIDSQAVFMEEALKAAEEVQKKEQAKAQKKSGGFANESGQKILHMLHQVNIPETDSGRKCPDN